MPTVLSWRGYRFHFFSNEGSEPPHIHVEKGGNAIKFWLRPVSVARNAGFSQKEQTLLAAKVEEERTRFIEAWNEHFNTRA